MFTSVGRRGGGGGSSSGDGGWMEPRAGLQKEAVVRTAAGKKLEATDRMSVLPVVVQVLVQVVMVTAAVSRKWRVA